jgi:chloramphenicol-sensitive protein RarD
VTLRTSQTGILYGIAAYGLWGFIPLYFKCVSQVAPLEILAHRALWSFVVLALLVRWLGRAGEFVRELRSGKLLLMLTVTTLLLAINWLTFIYSVVTQQVLQSSLGYFINPLVNVLLGVVFLRERLRPLQILSIALALAGVLVLTGLVGQVPWISLVLAVSFAFYALFHKVMPVEGLVSLTVETFLLAPVALTYLGYLRAAQPTTGSEPSVVVLLMLSGPVTTIPLLFFGAASRQLRLSTLGILQYLTPSLQFLLAVVAFREPFSRAQVLSFACIWTAVALYTADSLNAARRRSADRQRGQ